ncbi:MAG: T9SS type A sorting domain-containing protein [Crocinitomix sp.]|nr:T9SS type A sorting domain-containing protein [Crocinitomix sp.]
MRSILSIVVVLFFTSISFGQEAAFDWAGSIGSPDIDRVSNITIDNDGNTYLTGFYSNTLDFDPGIDLYELTPDGSDIYILKLNESGSFEWCISIGGPNSDVGGSIECDDSFIYVTGRFGGTVDFNPGPDVYELMAETDGDSYVLKIDMDGNFIWARAFGDALLDIGMTITVDDVGNIYTAGSYQGTVDFDPGDDVFDITSMGEEDVFIQKLDSEGNFIWAKSVGGESEDKVTSINVDEDYNVFISGSFEGEIDLNPELETYILSSSGLFDGFIEKLNSDGDFVWGAQIGGSSQDGVNSTIMDSEGNIYSTGYFINTVDFDPGVAISNLTSNGSTDTYVQKLDADGNFMWAKSAGGISGDLGNSIEIDTENNIFITGDFQETVDFNPNAGTFNLTSVGSGDIFIQKLDQDGEFIWAKAFGGSGSNVGKALAISIENDILLSGTFNETVDFNPGAAEYNLESEGSRDIFVLKLNACSPNTVTDEISSCISYTWSNGTTYYEDNNSATQTLLNIDGCDSIVTLDLTITPVDITTTAVGGVITSNAAGATYQWLDCNDAYSEISGETSVSYTPVDDGDYAVKVTIDDCTDTSACVAIDGVGINESALINQVRVYPNPSNGQFNIDLGKLHDVSIHIYSISGDLVYAANNLNGGLHAIELAVERGVYFVDVLTEVERGQFKLVVE